MSPDSISPKLFRVILQVNNIELAAEFYSRLLGQAGRRVSPGRHYFDCDGTILACLDPAADGDPHDPQPNVDFVYIAVPDVDHVYQAAVKSGAELAVGDIHGAPAGHIAVRPWGERSFYAHDPFGNKLCFVAADTMFTG